MGVSKRVAANLMIYYYSIYDLYDLVYNMLLVFMKEVVFNRYRYLPTERFSACTHSIASDGQRFTIYFDGHFLQNFQVLFDIGLFEIMPFETQSSIQFFSNPSVELV